MDGRGDHRRAGLIAGTPKGIRADEWLDRTRDMSVPGFEKIGAEQEFVILRRR